jgi:hypothetical protein
VFFSQHRKENWQLGSDSLPLIELNKNETKPKSRQKNREPHKSVIRDLDAASRCWWTIRDSNPGPIGYEPTALTN